MSVYIITAIATADSTVSTLIRRRVVYAMNISDF